MFAYEENQRNFRKHGTNSDIPFVVLTPDTGGGLRLMTNVAHESGFTFLKFKHQKKSVKRSKRFIVFVDLVFLDVLSREPLNRSAMITDCSSDI